MQLTGSNGRPSTSVDEGLVSNLLVSIGQSFRALVPKADANGAVQDTAIDEPPAVQTIVHQMPHTPREGAASLGHGDASRTQEDRTDPLSQAIGEEVKI